MIRALPSAEEIEAAIATLQAIDEHVSDTIAELDPQVVDVDDAFEVQDLINSRHKYQATIASLETFAWEARGRSNPAGSNPWAP